MLFASMNFGVLVRRARLKLTFRTREARGSGSFLGGIQARSLTSSRPISMRRISLVPAPMS